MAQHVNTNRFVHGKFHWQEGFGSFLVSQSQIDKVITYTDNQETHHLKLSFKQEYINFLKLYKIEFDEKYIFDWVE